MRVKLKLKIVSFTLASIMLITLFSSPIMLFSEELPVREVDVTTSADFGLTSKAAILMEASTGKVIYEQNADEALSPASITKIMTLLLIFEAIEQGKINLDDMVTTSEYAKSMGGSQVFLESGEQQSVDTMIKCIIIASGNDACVAMAEHISGSEGEFVNKMNEKAKSLGMTNTVFKDCCGLYDSMEHHTSARDVAVMSRELITKYPQVFEYSKIWMENITHVTDKGTKEFTLANTNKLLKQYQWTTGLKTGSTSLAKYCVSATARKDNIDLIAVIMGAPDYKIRFSEAAALLNFGFSNVDLYNDKNDDVYGTVSINGGTKEYINIKPEGEFNYVCLEGQKKEMITKKIILNSNLLAPIKANDTVGEVKYYIGETEIGKVNVLSTQGVKKADFLDYFKKICYKYMM